MARSLRRQYLVLLVFMGGGLPGPVVSAQSETSAAAQALSRLMPLPDHVSRTIMNPYHAEPAWKLWAIDPAPVTIASAQLRGTFRVPDVAQRQYPVFLLKRGVPELSFEPLGQTAFAGCWDDCYMSLDDHHTHLREPRNQFIDAGKLRTARAVETLLQLGVNFTSQSYADRGRALVDDVFNNLNTEKYFFFANCIRATPSHASYEDKDEDQVKDLYDGLFAHSYHSLGQSGSEVHALYKMMLAGACMPRSTKNLLKQHGAYAIVLLTLFKAALPYADAQGQPLPYEHELRHRPVYSSHGMPGHPHYCPANVHYHGYDEQRHLQAMMDMARELEHAPPVAVAQLLGFVVHRDGQTITDPARLIKQVKCMSLTNMRFWGQRGDTLEARINLNQSYDLQHRPLTFSCQALYPNQQNVTIQEEARGIFRIRVKHDPKLPKGRIPVICTARNGLAVPSNPVFVNFYWPDEKEADDYFSMQALSAELRQEVKAMGLERLPVTVNRRPLVDLGLVGDGLRCAPGQAVSIDLRAHDPEGFPVTVFRRSGQLGAIQGNRFVANIPDTVQDTLHRVHLIFSDGTGACTGRQIKLLVSQQPDALPPDWGVTALDEVPHTVNVSHHAGKFTFGTQPILPKSERMQGTFVFRPISRDADLVCRIPVSKANTDLALMITNTLDGFSRRARIGLFQGKVSGAIRSSEQGRPGTTYQWQGQPADRPQYFRLTLRDTVLGAYISHNGQTWEQVMGGPMQFFSQCHAGLIYAGNPWDVGECHWLVPGVSVPVVTTGKEKADPEGLYAGPLEIAIVYPDANASLHYTLDGAEPTRQSFVYQDPIKLTRSGRSELRARAFQAGAISDTVVATFQLK